MPSVLILSYPVSSFTIPLMPSVLILSYPVSPILLSPRSFITQRTCSAPKDENDSLRASSEPWECRVM
uniref:(California timema) hypothetical protein n=1 Tax=Timema californicum TaxID=61474 RepID=A0A7R9PD58_TIMCA|nr:unnamed protein product [Timema californicum]